MLTFIGRSLRFLRRKSHRIATAFCSGDSKFKNDIVSMENIKQIIESYSRQILNDTSHKQYAEVQKIAGQIADLERPIIRVEQAVSSQSLILNHQMTAEILDWASVVPYQKHFRVVKDKALNGTGQWLLQDTSFLDWFNSSRSQILWLHGSSGTGKSTLVSILLDSLINAHEHHQAPYPIYFFCSRNAAEPERADPEHILRCLMRQASDLPGGPLLHSKLKDRFEKRRTAGDISADEADDIILDTIKDRPLTYIIVDALDECDRHKRDTLIDALVEILSRSTSLVKIFVTSRDNHMDIALRMDFYPAVSIDATRNQGDVTRYIQSTVRDAIRRRKLLPTEKVGQDLQTKIEDSLCNGAQGMFRWVELQVKYLCTLRLRTVLLNRLEKLPPGLQQIYEDLYNHNMQDMGEEQAEVVRKILSWLLVALRPLTTAELIELVCAPEEPHMTTETVLDMCFDLVRLDEGQDQFRFSHLSVREFLESRLDEFATLATHDTATRGCLDVLGRDDSFGDNEYANWKWPYHAEYAVQGSAERCTTQLDDLLLTGNAHFSRWLSKTREWPTNEADLIDSVAHSIRLVSMASIDAILELENEDGENALFLASRWGKLDNVRIILDAGVGARVIPTKGQGAILVAALGGYANIVKLLLEHGVDANSPSRLHTDQRANSKPTTPLCLASSAGYVDIVKLLLDWGVDVEKREREDNATPLQVACRAGHVEIVQLLLEKGADVQASAGHHGTALQQACEEGRMDIVQILLERGADVQTSGPNGTALQRASRKGEVEIVRLLLDSGASAQDGIGSRGIPTTPIGLAARHGHANVVRVLLAQGTDARLDDDTLEIAAKKGHAEVVMLLLNASPESQPQIVLVAFFRAAARGDLDVLKVLLERGLSAHRWSEVLKSASCTISTKKYQLLLESVLSVALVLASQDHRKSVVKCLLEVGANLDQRAFMKPIGFSLEAITLLSGYDATGIAVPGDSPSAYELALWGALSLNWDVQPVEIGDDYYGPEPRDLVHFWMLHAHNSDELSTPGHASLKAELKTLAEAVEGEYLMDRHDPSLGRNLLRKADVVARLIREHSPQVMPDLAPRGRKSRSCERLRTVSKTRTKLSCSTLREEYQSLKHGDRENFPRAPTHILCPFIWDTFLGSKFDTLWSSGADFAADCDAWPRLNSVWRRYSNGEVARPSGSDGYSYEESDADSSA